MGRNGVPEAKCPGCALCGVRLLERANVQWTLAWLKGRPRGTLTDVQWDELPLDTAAYIRAIAPLKGFGDRDTKRWTGTKGGRRVRQAIPKDDKTPAVPALRDRTAGVAGRPATTRTRNDAKAIIRRVKAARLLARLKARLGDRPADEIVEAAECYRLKHIEGLRQPEIARRLGLSQPTVSRRLKTAEKLMTSEA